MPSVRNIVLTVLAAVVIGVGIVLFQSRSGISIASGFGSGACIRTHTVIYGQTGYGIAQANHVSFGKFSSANSGKLGPGMKPGTTLCVPPADQ